MAPILKVEVAASPEKQQQGLMYRRSLGQNSGMLFDFGQTKPLSFWMQNTYVPLQIAFMGSDGKIGQIERMSPMSTRAIRSHASYRYAIEVNDGWFDRHKIFVGAQMQLPGAQPQAAPAAVVLPFKDILEEANRHYNLRLLISYETKEGESAPPQVIRTPFTFVNSADGEHDAVIKAAVEGPLVHGEAGGPKVQKVSTQPDERIRSFIIDNITSISDLQGNPINSPEQVTQLAQTQPRPDAILAGSRQDRMRIFAQSSGDHEEYDVRVYVNDDGGYDVWCWTGKADGTADDLRISAKGNRPKMDEAIALAETVVRSRLGDFAAAGNVYPGTTNPPMKYPTKDSRYIYDARMFRVIGGSWHFLTNTKKGNIVPQVINPKIPGKLSREELVRQERKEPAKPPTKFHSDVFNKTWRNQDNITRGPFGVYDLPVGFKFFQGYGTPDWFVIDPWENILAYAPSAEIAIDKAKKFIGYYTQEAIKTGLGFPAKNKTPMGDKDWFIYPDGEEDNLKWSVFDGVRFRATSRDFTTAVKLAAQSGMTDSKDPDYEYETDRSTGLMMKRCPICWNENPDRATKGWHWVMQEARHAPGCKLMDPYYWPDPKETAALMESMRPKDKPQEARLSNTQEGKTTTGVETNSWRTSNVD